MFFYAIHDLLSAVFVDMSASKTAHYSPASYLVYGLVYMAIAVILMRKAAGVVSFCYATK